MKMIRFTIITSLIAVAGMNAQVETNTEKTITPTEVQVVPQEKEVIIQKDSKAANTSSTENDKIAEAAIAKKKAEREAEKQKARAALLEKVRKEGLLKVSDEDKEKRRLQIEAQKRKYEERKAKQKKKIDN